MKTCIREYAEGMAVEIITRNGRVVIKAYNEAGFNCTEVDLLDVLEWAAHKIIEILKETVEVTISN